MSEIDLIKTWSEITLDDLPHILRCDKSLREAASRNLVHEYRSYDDYIKDNDHGRDRNKFPFHTGLLPVPYAGCLRRAKMFLLMANPGFQPLDYYAEYSVKEFKPEVLRHLKQKYDQEDEYPMLYLDPKFAWHGGGEYWRKKFAWLLSVMKGTYVDCLKLLSQNIAVLEYVPYHSAKSIQDAKLKLMLSKLHSVKRIQAYVDSLVERADKEEILILDMRGGWSREKYVGKKNIIIYEGLRRMSAQISAKSPEIEKVIRFLTEKCKIEISNNWKKTLKSNGVAPKLASSTRLGIVKI